MLGSNCSRLQGPDTDPLSVDVLRQAIVEIVTDEIVGYEALSPDAERRFVFATSYRRGLV